MLTYPQFAVLGKGPGIILVIILCFKVLHCFFVLLLAEQISAYSDVRQLIVTIEHLITDIFSYEISICCCL